MSRERTRALVPAFVTRINPGAGHQRAHRLGDAPGLGDAAARREGRLGVEDLADGPEAGLGELLLEADEKAASAGAIAGVGLAARRRRTGRSASPTPSPGGRRRRARGDHRRSSACSRGAPGRQRPETEGRHQLSRTTPSTASQRARSRTGWGRRWPAAGWGGCWDRRRRHEGRPARRRRRRDSCRQAFQNRRLKVCSQALGARVDVGGVQAELAGGAPRAGLLLLEPPRQQPKRVVEERVDLDRLPTPRRHHPVAHLGVHPGQLVAVGALAQEAVAVVDADPEPGPGEVLLGHLHQLGEQEPTRLALAGRLLVAMKGVEEPEGGVGRVIEPLGLRLRERDWG